MNKVYNVFIWILVLKGTALGDWHFENLSRSHIQSQAKVSAWQQCFKSCLLKLIGQFSCDGIGWRTHHRSVLVSFNPSDDIHRWQFIHNINKFKWWTDLKQNDSIFDKQFLACYGALLFVAVSRIVNDLLQCRIGKSTQQHQQQWYRFHW